MIQLERIKYWIKDCILKLSSLRQFLTVYKIKWIKYVTDTWNHQIHVPTDLEKATYMFFWELPIWKGTCCGQELKVRSATQGVRGPNFSLHASGEAGRWQTGLLFHLHLYSNQGMFSVPAVLKPSRLRPLLNSTFCISPDILEATWRKES